MSNFSNQMSSFPSRLKQERHRLGMTQAEFAALGGVQAQAQLHYEKGSRRPNTDYLYAIAEAGVDLHYLITGQAAQPGTLALSVDEQRLLSGFRDMNVKEKRSVLTIVDAIVAALRRKER